jgi:HTH-type transcriptional regulator/antitoxin HigA
MANEPTSGWRPEWAVAPGEILLEALQDRGMTQSELANRTARPLKTINEIVKGKAAITPETALQLERVLGISARLWTGLEAAYRDHLAREEASRELEANAQWVDDFPIADLVRHTNFRRGTTKAGTLAQLLAFLGVTSPTAFDRQWLNAAASFRSSPAFMASPKAVATWLRWGEIEASKIPSQPFDAVRFRKVLDDIRPLTRRGPFMQILNKVKAMCAEAGVALVLTPEFKGIQLSGATRWVGGRPIIQLSNRYKSDDQFWFTFFHEAGHVLAPSRRRDVIDTPDTQASDTDPDEVVANEFARDALLPPDRLHAFIDREDFSASAVRSFAVAQHVASGIVVGRLQRDRIVPPSHLNDLKKPIHWPNQ